MDKLIKAIEHNCDEFDLRFRDSYSGRSFGVKCVGVVGSRINCMELIGCLIKEKATYPMEFGNGDIEEFSDWVDMLLSFETDSMGKDAIMYWPQLRA